MKIFNASIADRRAYDGEGFLIFANRPYYKQLILCSAIILSLKLCYLNRPRQAVGCHTGRHFNDEYQSSLELVKAICHLKASANLVG